MTNKQIYLATLGFSVRKLLYDFIALIFTAAACGVGFLAAEKASGAGFVGLAVGLVAALIVVGIVTHFFGYSLKAGQIAMMTEGIVNGSLPDDVIGEGKKVVKERFGTVAAFYAATRLIKGMFNEIGKGVNALGKAVGSDAGETAANAVNAVVQVIVDYLSDCCLGWVFFRSGQKAVKSVLEGAVLFFRNWKTFLKNMGRVFGVGAASLLGIGGAFTGVFYLVAARFPREFGAMAAELAEIAADGEGEFPAFLTDPKTLMIAAAALCGILVWGFIHSTFIRPFVLVGVLRNYLEAGMNDVPSEESFDELDGMSKKFAKARAELASD